MLKDNTSDSRVCREEAETKKPILIYGIGQQAQVVCHYLQNDLRQQVIGFVIDLDSYPAKILDLPVHRLGEIESILQSQQAEVFVAIGSIALNVVREHYVQRLLALGAKLTSCISPSASSRIDTRKSANTFIDPTCMLGPFTSVGQNLVLYNAVISHHCEINDNVSISSATVGANCRIGKNTVIALSATIESGVSVGAYSLIDSGALVKEDIPPYSVVTAPGSIIRRIDSRRVKVLGESLNGFEKRKGITSEL